MSIVGLTLILFYFFSGVKSTLTYGLKAIGLSDVWKVVRLMSLMAGSNMKALSNLSSAIASIISSDEAASKLVIFMCAQVREHFFG